MLGVEFAHFAFADFGLMADLAPEIAVMMTGSGGQYAEPSVRYSVLAQMPSDLESLVP